jgi:LPS-assembly protein
VRYAPGPNQEISFEYRYLRGQIDQFDTSVEWPIFGHLYGLGRVNFSAPDRTVIEGLAGIEYKGCCWVLRVAAQRFVTGLTTSQSTLFIQLELNGFSEIGSSPFDALRRNVVGYEPVKVLPNPASPFNNYE